MSASDRPTARFEGSKATLTGLPGAPGAPGAPIRIADAAPHLALNKPALQRTSKDTPFWGTPCWVSGELACAKLLRTALQVGMPEADKIHHGTPADDNQEGASDVLAAGVSLH